MKKIFISMAVTLLFAASATLMAFAAPNTYSSDLGSLASISDKDMLKEATETFVSLGIVKGKGTNNDGEVIIDYTSKITQQEMAMLVARTNSGLPDWFGATDILQATSVPVDELKQNLGIADINPIYLGAVIYCYENGLIDGKTVNPESAVTVLEAAEMLINALGYMNIPNGAVMEKATEIGLFAGLTKGLMNDGAHELTRGEAIMLMYNFFNSDVQLVGMWWNSETNTFSPRWGNEPVRARFDEYAADRLDPETINKNPPSVFYTFDNGEIKTVPIDDK